MSRKQAWKACECVALAKRVLEQEGDSFEATACGVVFRFRKEKRDFNLACKVGYGDHWVVEDAQPANGRWCKSKSDACVLVRSALRSEQGE